MSDKMYPLPLAKLFKVVLAELKEKKSIFGISQEAFFDPKKYPELGMTRFGQYLETPFGVAAGPQTQLSQNIISAWLTGSRYLELKTIQTLDELEISKPCIDMEDEGFNCEWSQELKLNQSFNEYLNAWIMIHILREELNIKNDKNSLGMIFNISAGYNLEGILNENVQTFFKKMRNAGDALKDALDVIRPLYPKIDSLNIPAEMTNNITLSTMHGCPPDEIEKIAMYLLEEQKLHTTVKLNPTLNGPEELRDILNNKLGFKNVVIPDIAFEHDLKYADGVKLIGNLKKRAAELGLFFGLKLTNTLESMNNKANFDKVNEMMYMSGRGLHALAINIAGRLQREFKGTLDISFSSGADAFNVADTLSCNLRPITVSSDLLKPGGYERMGQYAANVQAAMKEKGVSNIQDLVFKRSGKKGLEESILANLQEYREEVLSNKRYQKSTFPWDVIKTDRKLEKFDCIKAPCESTCPSKQQVPDYMYLCEQGRYEEALEVIRQNNPFPNSTGFACDHTCEDKCSRMNYDDTLKIRDIKRFIATQEKELKPISPKRDLNKSVGIIGGGPSGLSAAYFLALEGFKVNVYEAKEPAGGMITHALPNFRTIKDRVEMDIKRITDLGVTIHTNHPIESVEHFKKTQEEVDYIYVAVGAAKSKEMGVKGEEASNVIGFLEFLDDAKQGRLTSLAGNILVIGGGNSAIDAIRTANRLVKGKGKAMLCYRRTVEDMPASREEIEELLEENVEILELAAPESLELKDGKATKMIFAKMKLEGRDAAGRAKPVKTGEQVVLDVDMVIKAIGQDHATSFLEGVVDMESNGRIKTNDHQTSVATIFAGGDVVRGPASIIKGIADGKEVAFAIMKQEGLDVEELKSIKKDLSISEIKSRRRHREYGSSLPKIALNKRDNFDVVVETFSEQAAKKEAARCLHCDELCDVCTTVCPNRANVSYEAELTSLRLSDWRLTGQNLEKEGGEFKFEVNQKRQTLNVGDYCNECGNCRAFCPSSGRPYEDKPKLYLCRETYEEELDEAYFIEGETIYYKNGKEHYSLTGTTLTSPLGIIEFSSDLREARLVEAKTDGVLSGKILGEMSVLKNSLSKSYLLA